MKSQKIFYGWWVVVGTSIVTLWAGGIFYGITAFVKPIIEEFIIHGRLNDGRTVQSKQAEVLVYENLLVKSLRLYFDRLDFAEAVASGWLNRKIIQKLINESIKGLE